MSPASRRALQDAEIVMGPPRHLDLLPEIGAEKVAWPVPFADGLPKLLSFRGRKVVALASGDPFWFGAGSVIARQIGSEEWQAFPGVSVFSLAAARLGWPLETVQCHGLHAASFATLRPHLAPGLRMIVTLRDGDAVTALANWLTDVGFGESALHVMEALGGPRERVRSAPAEQYYLGDVAHPVAVAIELAGQGAVVHRASGQADDLFDHDGQITKAPVRAMTLAALAPKPGERLWDIGAGSGSVVLEWLMSHPATQGIAIEARPDRAARITANAEKLGQSRLHVVGGRAPEMLEGLPPPDAVFVGGGLSRET